MNLIGHIVLIGWIPLVLGLFVVLRPRIAVAAAMLIGWLFLPVRYGYNFEGVPPYDKTTIIALAPLLGVILFDAQRLMRFRPHLIDVPIAIWCVSPFIASMNNGLGAYDGISAVVLHTLVWGLAWLLGRLYFSDLEGLRVLAMAVLIGGLIYVPLCLIEVRLSPQLHRLTYGFHQHSWTQVHRFGGYRPDVYMQHGLMVAMWMAAATLVGAWMAVARAPSRIWHVPTAAWAGLLLVTTMLCKSVGATLLLALGLVLLVLRTYLRLTTIVVLVALIVPGYLSLRLAVDWDGEELLKAARIVVPERAASLEYRLDNEELLKAHAMRRAYFGWGRWSRYRLEEIDTTTDSLWIIALGQTGLLGMAAIFAALLLPTAVFILNQHRLRMLLPFSNPAWVLNIIVLLFALDCLFNAMINPIYLVAAGAVTGHALGLRPNGPTSNRSNGKSLSR